MNESNDSDNSAHSAATTTIVAAGERGLGFLRRTVTCRVPWLSLAR